MQNDPNKQPGLSWSTPKDAETPKQDAPVQSKLVPMPVQAITNKLTVGTQAPVYAGLVVGGIIVGVLLSTAWSAANGTGTAANMASSTTKTAASADAVTGTNASGTAPFTVANQKARCRR